MKISQDIVEDIFAQGRREAPNEACGYLAGNDSTVVKALALTNVDHSPEHFSVDPKEQFAAVRRLRAEGLAILGVYHTHPETPARPSAEDIRLACDSAIIYVIASLQQDGRDIRAFRIRQGVVTNETLVIEENVPMAEPVFDSAAYKKVGMIQQRQKEYFAMRLRAIGGDLTTEQLRKIAEVADRYGRSGVHLSTRQGVEIHYVHHTNLEKARQELASAGVGMGACGPRVRIVAACPGNATCRWGIIETKTVARDLDQRYFGVDTPHKFKMAVTGCPHNCAKATENDIGVMGAILPRWDAAACIDCRLCVNTCPTKAITREDVARPSWPCSVEGVPPSNRGQDARDTQGQDALATETPSNRGQDARDTGAARYVLDEDKCINCSICTSSCPASSWRPAATGYNLFIGGTMGKIPRLATLLKRLIPDKEELYRLIENALRYYQQHGRKKERFGHMIDRIGVEKVKEDILNG
jgi:dissimilatory sulfite reductase (desulfoviridin) alpha/beta subunit